MGMPEFRPVVYAAIKERSRDVKRNQIFMAIGGVQQKRSWLRSCYRFVDGKMLSDFALNTPCQGVRWLFQRLFVEAPDIRNLQRKTSLNDFAHIPWEGTPDFPKSPQRKKFLQKLVEKGRGYLPEVCGQNH